MPVERKLRNGARVLISELHSVPIVSIDVLFATGVNGAVVFRAGQFREGYGQTVKSGRYLRAGARRQREQRSAALV